jgi:DNA-binding IscR family transcriptional regulator
MIEIARRSRNGPVKRKDISKIQGISKAYLENILI